MLSKSKNKPKLGFLFSWFCKGIFKFYCPLSIRGQENLLSSPFIMCSNHCSHMDTPVLMLATGLSFNKFGMIAAKDYFFDNKKRKNMLHLFMNLISINRKCTKTSVQDNLHQCKNFIKQGANNLIIYPEGTRSLNGNLQTFKKGAALIAKQLNLPIIPVHIKGTYQSMNKGKIFPRPAKISALIGPAIYFEESHTYQQLTETLEKQIRQLEEQHQ